MTTNVGMLDRFLRIVVGLALVAWALGWGPAIGVPTTSYAWIGWIGVIPLVTGLLGACPAYTLLGLSTRPHAQA